MKMTDRFSLGYCALAVLLWAAFPAPLVTARQASLSLPDLSATERSENTHQGRNEWEIGPFTRPPDAQPVITPNAQSLFSCPMRKKRVHWEASHTFNPAAVVKDGKVYVLYRAEDDQGQGIGGYTSRLGLAWSEDGIHFQRRPEPVLFPANDTQKDREWYGGCEDPRVIELEDGTYVLFYTQYYRPLDKPRKTRLGMATSRDLIHWKKKGPVVIKEGGGKEHIPSKSASPVTTLKGGRLKATKIDGRYWLYYGESEIRVASSSDLVNWKAEGGVLLEPRKGCFDSIFTEAGPPAVLTERGIVFFYNGKNASPDRGGDTQLKTGVYCGGQALFDAADPTKLLDWPKTPFFKPGFSWEASGQYGAGTTFIEGLVFFQNRWLLYYGCADSYVGVAMAPN